MAANFEFLRAWGLYNGDSHSLMGVFSNKTNAISLTTSIAARINQELKNPSIDATLKARLEEFKSGVGTLAQKVSMLDNADKKGSEKREEIKALIKEVFGVGLESAAERTIDTAVLEKQLEIANNDIKELSLAAKRDDKGRFVKEDADIINEKAAEIAKLQIALDNALIAAGKPPKYKSTPASVVENAKQAPQAPVKDENKANDAEKIAVRPKEKAGKAISAQDLDINNPMLSNEERARRFAAAAAGEPNLKDAFLRQPEVGNRTPKPVLSMSEEDKKRIAAIDERLVDIQRELSTKGESLGLDKNKLLAERENLEKEKIEIKSKRFNKAADAAVAEGGSEPTDKKASQEDLDLAEAQRMVYGSKKVPADLFEHSNDIKRAMLEIQIRRLNDEIEEEIKRLQAFAGGERSTAGIEKRIADKQALLDEKRKELDGLNGKGLKGNVPRDGSDGANNDKQQIIDNKGKNELEREKDKLVHEYDKGVVDSLEKRIESLEKIADILGIDRSSISTEDEYLRRIKDMITGHKIPDEIKRILEEIFAAKNNQEKDALKQEISGLRAELTNMILSMTMGGMHGQGFMHMGAQGMFAHMNMGAGYGFMQGGMMGPMMIYGMMPVMPVMVVPVLVAQPAVFMGGFTSMMGGNMFGLGGMPQPQIGYGGYGYGGYGYGGYGGYGAYGQSSVEQTQTAHTTNFEITAQISRVQLELQLMEQKKQMKLAGPEIDQQIEQAKKQLDQLKAEAAKLQQQPEANKKPKEQQQTK